MAGLRHMFDGRSLEIRYNLFVRPIFDYADVVCSNASEQDLNKLEQLQYRAGRIVTGAIKCTSKEKVYDELCWTSLSIRRDEHKLVLFFKMMNKKCS